MNVREQLLKNTKDIKNLKCLTLNLDDEKIYYGSNVNQAPLKANKGSFFIITDNGLENGNIIDTYVFTKVWEKIGGIELSDIPDASETQRGLVNTGTQTFSGNKIIKGEATGNPFTVKNASGTEQFKIEQNSNISIQPNIRLGANAGRDAIFIGNDYFTVYTNWLQKFKIYKSGKTVIGGDISEGNFVNRHVILLGSCNSSGGFTEEQIFDVLGKDYTGNLAKLSLVGGKQTSNDDTSFVRIAYKKNELPPAEKHSLTINNLGSFGIGKEIPNPSAKLEIASTTQGFLPPRMTQAQREAISLPATGLIVYQTDGAYPGLYYKKDTGWARVLNG